MNSDAQTVAICQQLLFIRREEEELVQRDPYAPNEGPNHARHQALLAEEATLLAALARAQPPRTFRGIKAVSQLAMIYLDAERSPKDHRFAPNDMVEWTTLFALASAAGRLEAIPLPEHLPVYWPA